MSTGWSGEHYADNTAHHRAYDDVLLDRLRPVRSDATLVDVGCGVGDFTERLLDRVPDGAVIGIDADPSMVATARALHGSHARLSFTELPAQRLDQAAEPASVAAIVSTACLHWVPAADHPLVLSGARRLLAQGGQWCVEFGGAGQLHAMREVLDEVAIAFGGKAPGWFFPDESQYGSLLEEAGFVEVEVSLLRQKRSMADAAALRGLLTSQVLIAYLPAIDPARADEFVAAACDAVVADVEGRASGEVDSAVDYDVDYVRMVASAINPS